MLLRFDQKAMEAAKENATAAARMGDYHARAAEEASERGNEIAAAAHRAAAAAMEAAMLAYQKEAKDQMKRGAAIAESYMKRR